MTHPVKLDELLERFEFVPHEGSPHHWLCLTHGDRESRWGELEVGHRMAQETRDRWIQAYNGWKTWP